MNFRLFIVEMSVCIIWRDVFLQMTGGVLLNWFSTLPLESLPYVDGIFVTVRNLGLY